MHYPGWCPDCRHSRNQPKKAAKKEVFSFYPLILVYDGHLALALLALAKQFR
jgi:hypothetical protein